MIKSLVLRNFMAFREAEICFGPMTVLTGTNSAGKSSVIRGLAMLRQSHDAGLLSTNRWMLNGNLVNLGTGIDILFAEPTAIADSSTKFATTLELRENSGQQYAWSADAASDSDVLQAGRRHTYPGSQIRRDPSLLASKFEYLSADRAAPDTVYPKSPQAISDAGSLGVRGEHTANFLRIYGHSPVANAHAVDSVAAGVTYLEQTQAWLSALSPGSSVEVFDVPGTDFVTLGYKRLGQVWTRRQRATNVGYGMTIALPIIVAALAATKGSTLIVENPEIHLHPSGQAMVAKLLAKAAAGGAQVIVETHSDHVINSLRIAVKRQVLAASDLAINFFCRTKDDLNPTLQHIPVDLRGSINKWPEGFFDQYDEALSELIS